jgi:hypothetical protein
MENEPELKWYQKQTGIIILLVLFFPIGLYQMWKNKLWTNITRWIVTGAIIGIAAANVGNNNSSSSVNNNSSSSSSNSTSSSGPDICDCLTNASLIGTGAFNESLQNECETYSKSLSESERTQRVSEAFDRGCLK